MSDTSRILGSSLAAWLIASGCGEAAPVDPFAVGPARRAPVEAGGAVPAAGFELEPAVFAFGEVQLGTTSRRGRVRVSNVGFGPRWIRTSSTSSPRFTLDPAAERVDAGDSVELRATFAPDAVRPFDATAHLRVSTGDALFAVEVAMTGEGVSSELRVRPAALEIGPTEVETSECAPVEVFNDSQFRADVAFMAHENVTICGSDDPADFCIQPVDRNFRDDETFTLGSGETVELEICFAPEAIGPTSGSFTLSYCPQAACEITVEVSGTGFAI